MSQTLLSSFVGNDGGCFSLGVQEAAVHALLLEHKEGLADFEIQECLRSQLGFYVPKSTISARRDSINQRYVSEGFPAVIVHGGDYRTNPATGVACRVWKCIV